MGRERVSDQFNSEKDKCQHFGKEFLLHIHMLCITDSFPVETNKNHLDVLSN